MSTIEFLELYYLEEIDSLFKELQEISRAYNLSFLHKMNKDNSSDLFNFILQSIEIQGSETQETEVLSDQGESYS